MAASEGTAPVEEGQSFALDLTFKEGYQFAVDYAQPGMGELLVDEFPPIGAGRGPNPSRMLATAVGHCLASSFLFCVRKARVEVTGLAVRVEGAMVRNERGRLRIGEIKVRLSPSLRPGDRDRIGRCLELFEDFCIVTQSVRHGVNVAVDVTPQA